MNHFTIHADGGSRGNPGPAGSGAVVRDNLGNLVATVSEYLGVRTNNYAEYEAIILALAKVQELAKGHLADTVVMVKMDSELVVKQMSGVYKVKHPDMKAQYARAKELAAPFGLISFAHVPRAENSDADALANEAMDRRA
jgi:ribonuclease HI